VLIRSWNLFHGNSSPPQRRGFLDEMILLATADNPDVLCVQEVPAWALSRFTVGALASRPPFGAAVGRVLTAPHHGLIRGGVAGQGVATWLGEPSRLLEHAVSTLNPRAYRARRARALGLDRAARWTWAKEARIVQVIRLEAGGRHVVIANTHCTGYAGDSRIPDDELLAAARFTESATGPDDVVVLAGDFNLRPGRSRALSVLTGPERGFSVPGPGIDHILVRNATASRLRVWPAQRRRRQDGTLLSDHAPVELEVTPHTLEA
jgi:endonuclease/exonuclease/phosphatase family metal-dependent hydrolase